jgi:hypothetical protein
MPFTRDHKAFVPFICAPLVGLFACAALLPGADAGLLPGGSPNRTRILQSWGRLPMQFEPAGSGFLARGRGYSLLLTRGGAALAARDGGNTSSVEMQFLDASPHSRAEALDALPGRVNYFSGKDPKRWRTNVPTFGRVMYHDVWPGIDLVYYGNQSELEYDFMVRPGADVKRIRFRFRGGKPRIDAGGDLVLPGAHGEVRHRKPVIYQETAASRREISGRYVLRGGEVGFRVARYDRAVPLVIDPTLLYSTMLGTGGALGLAVDSQGNAYVTGTTTAIDFATAGAFDGSNNGSSDIFVAKLTPAGTALVYATYVGGSRTDGASAIAVDPAGNAYVSGATRSADFPVVNAAQSGLAGVRNAVAFKLNPSGSQLLYSTYFGGSGEDFAGVGGDEAAAIAIDPSGNAYLTGTTTSTNLPVTPSALQLAYGGGFFDSFVLKLSSTGAKVFATYLGGSVDDYALSIAVDKTGRACVTGDVGYFTGPIQFPVTGGAYTNVTSLWDMQQLFVAKLNPAGTSLEFSTMIGGAGGDIGYAIAVDDTGIYVAGETSSSDFPATSGTLQPALAGEFDAVVFKLNPTGSTLLWSTFLGGTERDEAHALSLDPGGNVYVAGTTYSRDFPLVNALRTTMLGASAPLYRSFDGGNNWMPVSIPYETYADQLLVSRSDPKTVFLFVQQLIFRSTDSGANWTLLQADYAQCLAIDPQNDSVLYIGTYSGVQKSTDRGATWTAAGTGLPAKQVLQLAVDGANSNIVYAATDTALYRSTDAGNNWSPMTALPDAYVTLIGAHPVSSGVLFARTPSQFYRSADGGSHWDAVNVGTSLPLAIAFSPSDPGTAWFPDCRKVWRSRDAGATWTSVAATGLHTLCVTSLIVDPGNPNTLYGVSNARTVVKSADGGSTWTAASYLFALNNIQLAGSSTPPLALYVTTAMDSAGFVAKINPGGTALLYTTLLGGQGGSSIGDIAADGSGTAVVAGYVYGYGVTTPGSLRTQNSSPDAFIARIGDSAAACSVALNPPARSHDAAGWPDDSVSLPQDGFAVIAPSGCSWAASTTASWIHLLPVSGAPLSGAGVGVIFYSVDANSSAVPRTGTISVGGQTFTITQSRQPPSAPVSISPGAGTGMGGIVAFTFNDPRGWQDLDVGNILINDFLDGRHACYLAYSVPSGVLYLVNDAGTALLPGLVLNGSGTLYNSQCTVNGAGSSVTKNGQTLTLNLNLFFGPGFTGNKILYLAARDLQGGNSGWQALGTWGITNPTPSGPAVGGVSPARSSGPGGRAFTFTFTDTNGWQDLGVVNILVNDALDGRNACYLAYSRVYNVLYLVNDPGTALLPGLTLNGSGTLSNSQCTVTGAGSSASGSGNTLTLTLNMTFPSAFAGNRIIYMAARSNGDALNSGWQAAGSRKVE